MLIENFFFVIVVCLFMYFKLDTASEYYEDTFWFQDDSSLVRPVINGSDLPGRGTSTAIKRSPNDKVILIMTSVVHFLGFLGFFTVQSNSLKPANVLIENLVWHSNAESLSKFYYIGYTLVRVILRVYDCVRDPVANPEIEFIENRDSVTTLGNIAVVVIMIILVIVVYNQQSKRINIASDYHEDAYGFQDDPSLVSKYTRFVEIKQQCRKFQSCGSELKYDYDELHILKEQLTFVNGDWEQESGDSPLMPFNGMDMPGNNSPIYDPLKLINFRVTDINPVRWKKFTSVTNVVAIGITRYTAFGYDLRSRFSMDVGSSVLSITFEGVYYMENNENGGERLLCLLGNSSLPFRKSYKNASDLAMRHEFNYNYQPPLLPDHQILLVLRYPQIASI
ncbi:hypothetical protein ACFE04_014110 [Oxalis oulophora]